MTQNKYLQHILCTAAACLFSTTSVLADELDTVEVTADFYQTPALELGSSVSVFDEVNIEERGAEHLEQLLNLAPNVNYAAGASRGRYIQIRGIGERSQFVDPINPSVGLLIDGIDFTGIGTAASLLDIKQVEILRGPQGTLYGANALAGLINMVSYGPSDETSGTVGLSLADYDTRTVKGALGGPVNNTLGYRLAVQSHVSDGYINNVYLDRDDTNNIDETTLRGKLRWQPRDDLTLDFVSFRANIENGYDAFSLDNTRETLSDEPGVDKQQTSAGGIKADWKIMPSINLIANVSHADSKLEYNYDEDWAYPELCLDFTCLFGADSGYSSFDNYLRHNRNTTVDLRAVGNRAGTQWVGGIYLRDQEVDLTRIYTFEPTDFSSEYATSNSAIYGQLEKPVGEKLKAIAGLRFEKYDADYNDSEGFIANPDEDLVGGKLGLEYQIDKDRMVYGLVSRGYKSGGFNASDDVPENRRVFDSESMWNYETGLKGRFMEGKLTAQFAVFYQDRKDIQAKQYFAVQDLAVSPATRFVDFIDNAASGSNYGLEAELQMVASDRLSLFASLGLLRTEFDDFTYFDSDGNEIVKDGRDQAHAPHYQYSLGGNYLLTPELVLRLDVEGKDEFYFSDSHDQKSDAYNLFNARLSYYGDNWEVSLWGRNLGDEEVQVRGFEFGNDPRDGYASKAWYQYGEPRIVGVTAEYNF